jgi:tyrosyl-tRNA synthetase
MDAKKFLAILIATQYHEADPVTKATIDWSHRFSERKDPENIEDIVLDADLEGNSVFLFRLVFLTGFVNSNTEARNLIKGGGVTIGEERTKHVRPEETVVLQAGLIIRVGKRKIGKLKFVKKDTNV